MKTEFLRPVPQNCQYCNRGTASPKLFKRQDGNKIITEGRWICGCCGNLIKKGTICEEIVEAPKQKVNNALINENVLDNDSEFKAFARIEYANEVAHDGDFEYVEGDPETEKDFEIYWNIVKNDPNFQQQFIEFKKHH